MIFLFYFYDYNISDEHELIDFVQLRVMTLIIKQDKKRQTFYYTCEFSCVLKRCNMAALMKGPNN